MPVTIGKPGTKNRIEEMNPTIWSLPTKFRATRSLIIPI